MSLHQQLYKKYLSCMILVSTVLFPILSWAEGGGGGGDLGGQGGSGPELSTYASLLMASLFLAFAYYRKNKDMQQKRIRVKAKKTYRNR